MPHFLGFIPDCRNVLDVPAGADAGRDVKRPAVASSRGGIFTRLEQGDGRYGVRISLDPGA